jgi:hypothetical protein
LVQPWQNSIVQVLTELIQARRLKLSLASDPDFLLNLMMRSVQGHVWCHGRRAAITCPYNMQLTVSSTTPVHLNSRNRTPNSAHGNVLMSSMLMSVSDSSSSSEPALV